MKVQFKPITKQQTQQTKLSQPKMTLEVKRVPKSKPTKPNIVQQILKWLGDGPFGIDARCQQYVSLKVMFLSKN